MAWTEGQLFKCTNFTCGSELKLVAGPHDRRVPDALPTCFCGSPMKRWPEAALGSDPYEDV